MLDYDRLAAKYAQFRQIHPAVLRNLLDTSGVGAPSQVLEVGCGTGNYILALHEACGCTGYGIDPSAQMLAQPRSHSDQVTFRIGSAEQIEFPNNTFDLLFSVDVIHHVPRPLTFFREAFRVLKAGGQICTATDSAEIIHHRQPLSVYFPETVAVDLERYPPIAELRGLYQQALFRHIREFTVEFATTLNDIQMYRDRTFSCLHLISEEAFQEGLRRMEGDLRKGPLPYAPRYLLLWGTKEKTPTSCQA
jgi:ubiquinone/menaquinone biosynthesis C-methylase UbiE